MSADNKTLARRVIEELWNKHDATHAEQFLAPDYVGYDPATPFPIQGLDGFRRFFNLYTTAFPDQKFTIDDLIAEDDRVVTRWTMEGTHSGPLPGIPATGKRIRVTGTNISRIENGRIAEEHIHWDALGMMQQLGVVQRSARA